MVLKKKHSKQLKKIRQKKETEKAKNEPDVDFDTSAYVVYNRLGMTYPCLSFDIVKDELGSDDDRVKRFPLSLYMVAGAQTPAHVENNYIYVMKIDNIKPLKQENENLDDEGESDEEGEEDPNDLPRIRSVRIGHKGCANRLRVNRISGKTMAATWSDKGKVHIYDLTFPIHAVKDQRSINTYTAQKNEQKPIYTFGGHFVEGYALDWAPHRLGGLATGDCKKNIHIWSMRNQADWNVDQQPLVGHSESVEDIKWSPDEADVLASCSVDKSIRFWDLRQPAVSRCVTQVLDAHKSDVNVIDWNKISKNLLVSGGDDGVVKVWDIRHLKRADKEPFPVAQFDHHKKPITSLEWDPNDDTVIAVSSEDDRLTLWDLAVEQDDEHEAADDMEVDVKKDDAKKDDAKKEDGDSSSSSDDSEDENDEDEEEEEEEGVEYEELKTIPEQMLFLHQGQAEIKELHWHPQLKGLIISTAANGLNIFKTISA